MRLAVLLAGIFVVLSSSLTLASGSLNLVIDSPPRGEILTSSDPINITGRVLNFSPLTTLTVNDRKVSYAADGSFNYTLFPQIGNNVITALAKTPLKGNALTTRSIYQSDQWLEFDNKNNETATYKNAIEASLDGNSISHSVNLLQKGFGLGFAVQQRFNELNSTRLLAEPIFEADGPIAKGSHYYLKGYLKSLNALQPVANATIQDDNRISLQGYFGNQDGLKGFTAVLDVDAKIKLFDKVDCDFGKFKIIYSADQIHFAIDSKINKVSGKSLDIDILDMSMTEMNNTLAEKIAHPQTDSFFQPWDFVYPASIKTWVNWFLNIGLDKHKEEIIRKVNRQIHRKLSSVFTKVLHEVKPELKFKVTTSSDPVSWATYHPETELSWTVGELSISKKNVAVGLDTKVKVDQSVGHAPKPIFMRGNCDTYTPFSPNFDTKIPINAFANVDYVNQVFHALWWGGLFDMKFKFDDFKLSKYHNLDIQDIDIEVEPMLPPIFDDCEPKAPYLQIGDAKMKINFTTMGKRFEVEAYASANASAQFESLDDKIVVSLVKTKFTSFDIIMVNGNSTESAYWLEELFWTDLIPKIEEKISHVKLFRFSVPNVPLYQVFNWLTFKDDFNFYNLSLAYQTGHFEINAYVK